MWRHVKVAKWMSDNNILTKEHKDACGERLVMCILIIVLDVHSIAIHMICRSEEGRRCYYKSIDCQRKRLK